MAVEVSVVIPNYNHSKFLPLRIESVINQTFSNIEIIILDDKSNDNSREIISFYAEKDKRIRTFFNEENSGSPFKQWNKGVEEAKGKYVWIAESDDYSEINFLEILLKAFYIGENTGIVYCDSNHLDENNNKIEFNRWTDDLDKGRWKQDYFNVGIEECRNYLVYKNIIINASAVVFEKRKYLEAGMADVALKYAGDWMIWARILMISNVYYVSTPLNYFRHHSATTRTSKNLPEKIKEHYQCINYIADSAKVEKSKLNGQLKKLFSLWHLESPFYLIRTFNWSLYLTARKIDHFIEIRIILFLLLYPFNFIKRKLVILLRPFNYL